MDLGLTRVDLLQVSVTHPKTTKLLPTSAFSEKAQQKVFTEFFDHEKATSNLYSRLLWEIEREYYKCFLAGKAKFSILSRLYPVQRSPEWSWEGL